VYAARPLLLALALIFLPSVNGNAQQPAQQGYSTEPLRDPILDQAHVLVETMAFNNWLTSNYQGLSHDRWKGPREYLYYLIDSRVKDNYVRTGKVFPEEHDVILEQLFSWAERLGAYGGSLVYNRLRTPPFQEMSPALQLPQDISLALKDDLFTIKSDSGRWSISFPYYFMIWNVSDSDTKNGLHTQLIALSTGTARDNSKFGHSQATLLLIFSPTTDTDRFVPYWQHLFGIESNGPKEELSVRGLSAQYRVDPQTNMHTEFVSWSAKKGQFAVIYSGMDGTYQWNRQHFLDFLNALQVD
jgi:hypothetical protein